MASTLSSSFKPILSVLRTSMYLEVSFLLTFQFVISSYSRQKGHRVVPGPQTPFTQLPLGATPPIPTPRSSVRKRETGT